jgi:hypothetical protein
MKLSRTLIIGLSLVAGVWWGLERNRAALLRAQIEARRGEQGELARLRAEHERLLRAQPSAEELDRLARGVWTREAAAVESGVARGASPAETRALRPGVWAAAAEWKNCGRATPEAAVETTLWAAAGGELGALKEAFAFDEDTRARAEKILAGLPGVVRRQYATPEALLALFVARDVPQDSMRVVTRQQHDDDNATVYVRVKDAEGKTRPIYLTLRRDDGGWRLLVPAQAVENIARELAGAPGS